LLPFLGCFVAERYRLCLAKNQKKSS